MKSGHPDQKYHLASFLAQSKQLRFIYKPSPYFLKSLKSTQKWFSEAEANRRFLEATHRKNGRKSRMREAVGRDLRTTGVVY